MDEDEEDLETPEMKEALLRLGERPSQSAEATRAHRIEEMRALSMDQGDGGAVGGRWRRHR